MCGAFIYRYKIYFDIRETTKGGEGRDKRFRKNIHSAEQIRQIQMALTKFSQTADEVVNLCLDFRLKVRQSHCFFIFVCFRLSSIIILTTITAFRSSKSSIYILLWQSVYLLYKEGQYHLPITDCGLRLSVPGLPTELKTHCSAKN